MWGIWLVQDIVCIFLIWIAGLILRMFFYIDTNFRQEPLLENFSAFLAETLGFELTTEVIGLNDGYRQTVPKRLFLNFDLEYEPDLTDYEEEYEEEDIDEEEEYIFSNISSTQRTLEESDRIIENRKFAFKAQKNNTLWLRRIYLDHISCNLSTLYCVP